MILRSLKTDFPDKWKYINQDFAYPYESFTSIGDCREHFKNLKEEVFFSKLKNKCPNDKEKEKIYKIRVV